MSTQSKAGRDKARTALVGVLVLAAVLVASGGGTRTAAQMPNTLLVAPTDAIELAQVGDLSRFQYVIVNAWNHDLIAQLKARNPEIKLLVYKDMSSSRSYTCRNGVDDVLLPAGIGYCWADQHRPDWFTVDTNGSRIEWQPWPGSWQMDVGNPGYQDAWAENVLQELRRHRWDGVFIDNADLDRAPLYFPGREMQEYPDQPAYQAATRAFLARVGPRLKAEGFLVLPNIQSSPELATPSVWKDWTQFTSGGVHQYWMKWGQEHGGRFGGGYWLQLQKTFDLVQRAGKLFLTGTPAPRGDVESMRFGRASFLLGWNGGPAGYGAGGWHPEWTIEVGRPRGPRYRVGTAWRREYTGGTVLANIGDSHGQTVALGGSYLHPDGSAVSSVTLPPLTGLVLRKAHAGLSALRLTPTAGGAGRESHPR